MAKFLLKALPERGHDVRRHARLAAYMLPPLQSAILVTHANIIKHERGEDRRIFRLFFKRFMQRNQGFAASVSREKGSGLFD